ncbi:MAG: cobalt-precorrin-6A reductase [Actinomycetota bacterium]
MTRLLILGGTREAADLARAVAERLPAIRITSSLAGRAGVPDLPGEVRVGGFGGAPGLADWLRNSRVDAVVDATHPFAERISAHAAAACAETGVPLLRFERAAWCEQPGDRWHRVPDLDAAAAALPSVGRRAFLTVGAGGVAAFAGVQGVWFLVRLLAPATLPLADYTVTVGRGPFAVDAEAGLMCAHRIDVLVTKASGGAATAAKLEAARQLGLPVLVVDRGNRHLAATKVCMAYTLGEAIEWLSRMGSNTDE